MYFLYGGARWLHIDMRGTFTNWVNHIGFGLAYYS